jgi:signal transduction histidine kinase
VLRAEVSHGKLVVTVKDSGVGYFPAEQDATSEASQGGFGLKNIRDRLALIYGEQGSLSIRALEPYEGSGTLALLTVPYKVAPIEATFGL